MRIIEVTEIRGSAREQRWQDIVVEIEKLEELYRQGVIEIGTYLIQKRSLLKML